MNSLAACEKIYLDNEEMKLSALEECMDIKPSIQSLVNNWKKVSREYSDSDSEPNSYSFLWLDSINFCTRFSLSKIQRYNFGSLRLTWDIFFLNQLHFF